MLSYENYGREDRVGRVDTWLLGSLVSRFHKLSVWMRIYRTPQEGQVAVVWLSGEELL